MSTRKRTQRKRIPPHNPLIPDPKRYATALIKALEGIVSATGHRPSIVYDDFLHLTEATLKVLPEQLVAVGTTGKFNPDTPEVAAIFQQIEARYRRNCYGSFEERVWRDGFCQAFALLLEGAAPGLWAYRDSAHGSIMGPDILGDVYQSWAQADPSWQAQYFTPYNLALCMGKITLMDIEQIIHQRLKEALCHPDNILGAATLLAGLAIPEERETGIFQEYFINKMIPAAYPYYDPVLFNEPCIGSGVMVLAAAACCPPWAVKYALIRFSGMDIDATCVKMSSISTMIYGLNGYALKLEGAASKALAARQQQTNGMSHPKLQSPAQILRNVYRNDATPPSSEEGADFEQIFRVAAGAAVPAR
jgi:hypothetical protein